MVNSRLGLFTATLSRSVSLGYFTLTGYLFSRSYEVILPSSLARVVSRTLVFSTYLPVAVYGTVAYSSHCETFLGSVESASSSPWTILFAPYFLTPERIFLLKLATRLNKLFHSLACLSSCVLPQLLTIYKQYRNINLLSIDYAFRPRLRYRLTLRGRACQRKP